MTRRILASILSVSFVGLPLVVGCDREVEHTESKDVKSDGTVVKKEKTISETPSGDVKKEESKTVDKP